MKHSVRMPDVRFVQKMKKATVNRQPLAPSLKSNVVSSRWTDDTFTLTTNESSILLLRNFQIGITIAFQIYTKVGILTDTPSHTRFPCP